MSSSSSVYRRGEKKGSYCIYTFLIQMPQWTELVYLTFVKGNSCQSERERWVFLFLFCFLQKFEQIRTV